MAQRCARRVHCLPHIPPEIAHTHTQSGHRTLASSCAAVAVVAPPFAQLILHTHKGRTAHLHMYHVHVFAIYVTLAHSIHRFSYFLLSASLRKMRYFYLSVHAKSERHRIFARAEGFNEPHTEKCMHTITRTAKPNTHTHNRMYTQTDCAHTRCRNCAAAPAEHKHSHARCRHTCAHDKMETVFQALSLAGGWCLWVQTVSSVWMLCV